MGIGKGTQEVSKVLAMFLTVNRVYTEVHCIVITHFNDHLFYMAFK